MSIVQTIHHINYLVKDLAASVNYFELVLSQSPEYESLPHRKAKTARFLLGKTYLVLVCPQDTDSELGKMLAERGEGLFLLSLATPDLANAKSALQQKDIHFTAAGQRNGLSDWRVVDLEAPAGLGPILQLCQQTGKINNQEG